MALLEISILFQTVLQMKYESYGNSIQASDWYCVIQNKLKIFVSGWEVTVNGNGIWSYIESYYRMRRVIGSNWFKTRMDHGLVLWWKVKLTSWYSLNHQPNKHGTCQWIVYPWIYGCWIMAFFIIHWKMMVIDTVKMRLDGMVNLDMMDMIISYSFLTWMIRTNSYYG